MTMLHTILTSMGTDGDVNPFLGLGARLRARGHRVTLVANEHFGPLAAAQGLAFRPLLTDAEYQQVLADPAFWHPLKGALLLARWGARYLGRHYDLLAELARDGPSILVSGPAILAARLVQEKLARPMASVILQPWVLPSLTAPPIMPAGLTLPSWAPRPLGRLYWRLVDAVGDLLIGPSLNRVRAGLGLAPVRRLFRWWLSPQLILGLFPPWYGPPQADWPPQVHPLGFPLYDGKPGHAVPAEVLAFCQDGPPPIAFTFGTGMKHGERLFRAAAEACRRLGVRGLLLTPFREQLPTPLSPLLWHCDFAPFLQLFPHCAAVVHHGGVGTMAKALATGTPQLILPLAYDQLDNATRVRRLGAGDWLGPRQRSGARVAQVLSRLLAAEARKRCHAVAAHFGAVDPLEVAADWVEKLAQTHKLG
jgi:UDP:flavonoid glycosyltransferase YjiC (YdhE family)